MQTKKPHQIREKKMFREQFEFLQNVDFYIFLLTHITEDKSDPVEAPHQNVIKGRSISGCQIVSISGKQPLLHTLDFVP